MSAPSKPYIFSDTPPNTNVISAAQVNADFDALYAYLAAGVDTYANGSIPEAALSSALAQKVGLNAGGNVGRGKSIIATEESTTSTSYTYLATPDRVQNVVLPTDGLIFVAYQATWRSSVHNAGSAAVFLGSSQLKSAPATGHSALVVGATSESTTAFAPLASNPSGINGSSGDGIDFTGDATTGQIIGRGPGSGQSGICAIFAAAGTYDIGVQFKVSSGSVTAKERKLWVWTMGF